MMCYTFYTLKLGKMQISNLVRTVVSIRGDVMPLTTDATVSIANHEQDGRDRDSIKADFAPINASYVLNTEIVQSRKLNHVQIAFIYIILTYVYESIRRLDFLLTILISSICFVIRH